MLWLMVTDTYSTVQQSSSLLLQTIDMLHATFGQPDNQRRMFVHALCIKREESRYL